MAFKLQSKMSGMFFLRHGVFSINPPDKSSKSMPDSHLDEGCRTSACAALRCGACCAVLQKTSTAMHCKHSGKFSHCLQFYHTVLPKLLITVLHLIFYSHCVIVVYQISCHSSIVLFLKCI